MAANSWGSVTSFTYLNEQHTVTWIVAEETRTESYYSGAIIRVPEVNAAEGYLFAGWDGEVPFRMGSSDLIFVAKFVAHTHDHFKTVSGSCDTGATYTYTCSCGHSYTVTAEPTAHVFVANVAYHEDVAYASVTCSACGKVYQEETAIGYQAAASDRADAEFFDLTLQAGSTPVQPDGTIIVRVALEEDNLLNADKLYAFRIEDGGKTEVQVEKDGSFALLYLDHFSYYMITDKPEDQAQAPAFQSVSCMFNGHSYTDTVTSPTCTEQGYTIHTCSSCGDTFTDSEVPPKGHSFGAWTKLDNNQHQRVCANDSTHVEKANHTWNAGAITKDAKCEETGIRTYTCTTCSATRSETIQALGHTAPNGKGDCDRCGKHLKDVDSGSSTPAGACKYCGQVHTCPFGWLIKFFHSILALFGLRK